MNMAFEQVENELKVHEYNISLSSLNVDSKESLNKLIETTKLDNIENYTILRKTGLNIENRRLNPEYIDFLNLKLNDEVEKNAKEYINLYALGEEQYKKYIKELGLNYDEVKDKGILMDYTTVGRQTVDNTKNERSKVIYKTLRHFDFKTGEVLSGNLESNAEFKLEIGCITDKVPFGLKNYQNTYFIVSDELYNKIADLKSDEVKIFYYSNNANKLQDDIDSLLQNESYDLYNIEESVRTMNNLYTLVGIFLYGFIIVISLIGITNIFNTITTNMELRRQEFATLKSVGMTTKEFDRMIRLETFFMGIKSLLFGIPIGVILSYIIYHFLSEGTSMRYKLPILALVISVLAVFILISLIMKYSMSKINKQNIIETIRNENI